jgi:cytochrome c oxidase cbb3-type subunit 3/ubiquinol-cytochrome c reductase cytochrome c subunit
MKHVSWTGFVGATLILLGACNRARPPATRETASAASSVAAASSAAALAPAAPASSAVPADPVKGGQLYARMCVVCHGANGEGYRADAAPALAQPDFLASVTDDFLDFAIAIGRRGTTMSAWRNDQGGPLSAADVASVVAFMRTWQPHEHAPIDETLVPGDEAHGKAIFEKTCASCHVPKGASVHIMNRQWLVHARPAFLRYAIAHGRPPTPMKGFADVLGQQGVNDVVAYLRSLPSWLVPGELAGSSKPPPIPLGPVPLNAKGPEPRGFRAWPDATPVAAIWAAYEHKAKVGILDARAPSDYGQSHIANAVSVPYYDPVPYLDALPKNVWLVCYCGCPHAESGALAKQLFDAGFHKVTILDEGYGAWTAAGHPTNTGIEP